MKKKSFNVQHVCALLHFSFWEKSFFSLTFKEQKFLNILNYQNRGWYEDTPEPRPDVSWHNKCEENFYLPSKWEKWECKKMIYMSHPFLFNENRFWLDYERNVVVSALFRFLLALGQVQVSSLIKMHYSRGQKSWFIFRCKNLISKFFCPWISCSEKLESK